MRRSTRASVVTVCAAAHPMASLSRANAKVEEGALPSPVPLQETRPNLEERDQKNSDIYERIQCHISFI